MLSAGRCLTADGRDGTPTPARGPLDQDFETILREFSEDDLHHKQIDRGHGFTPSPYVQFQIYHEALLMFYAKASVYLKALQKAVNDEWQAGIG